MTRPLRIVVADDEPDMQDYFRRLLPRLGHRVVAVAGNGRELVERCRELAPDLVLTDIKMPELDGIDAATQIYLERPVPILLVSAYHDAGLVERAAADHVLGYLVKPIKQSDLGPAIALALRRFEQLEALRREADDLRQALAQRRVVERAVAALGRAGGLDEDGAFRRLRELAAARGAKLVTMAEAVLAEGAP